MACLRPHSQDRVELGFEPRPSDKERAFASCLGVCVAAHSGSGSSPRNPPRPGEGAPSQGQPHPVTVALGTASILSTPGTGERNAGPAQPCSALQGRTHSPASSATPALGSIRGHLTPAFTPRQSWVSATAAGRRSQHLSRWRVPQPPPYAPALSPTPLSTWDQFLCQAALSMSPLPLPHLRSLWRLRLDLTGCRDPAPPLRGAEWLPGSLATGICHGVHLLQGDRPCIFLSQHFLHHWATVGFQVCLNDSTAPPSTCVHTHVCTHPHTHAQPGFCKSSRT